MADDDDMQSAPLELDAHAIDESAAMGADEVWAKPGTTAAAMAPAVKKAMMSAICLIMIPPAEAD
jgi:hypothetical protein